MITRETLDFIKSHEGLRLKAYIDPVGVPTIGYGSIRYENGDKVAMGEQITIERAEKLLKVDVERRMNAFKHLVQIPLTDNQWTALLSFVYNLGIGAFEGSTLRKRINGQQSEDLIRAAFMMWTKGKVNGKLVNLPGLIRRRQQEADLYFS